MPPNPALLPIKAFVRQHGGQWPARAFNPPRTPRQRGVVQPDRVYVIEPKMLAPGRRFALVARDWDAAYQRLSTLLS